MLHKLNQASLKVRLSMNLKKTKVIYRYVQPVCWGHTGTHDPRNRRSRSLHLSKSMHFHGFCLKGTRDHPWMASFGRARSSAIFRNKDILIIIKCQVYDQCILPTVTYTDQKPGILRNNKSWILELCWEPTKESWQTSRGKTIKQLKGSEKKPKYEISWNDK